MHSSTKETLRNPLQSLTREHPANTPFTFTPIHVYKHPPTPSTVQSGSDLLPIPTGHDFIIFLYTAVTCFIVNWSLRILLIEPLARRVLPTVTKKKVEKYAQAGMEMTFYSAFFFFGYR